MRAALEVYGIQVLTQTDGWYVEAYADAIAAFSVAYTLSNPLWGSILDRIGLRIGMPH